MDMTNCADCGPPIVTIALILLAAGIAALIAYRVRWTIGISAPLLGLALVRFANGGYAHRPAGWLVVSVIIILAFGILAGRRRSQSSSRRPA
jgi:hypothetical protein